MTLHPIKYFRITTMLTTASLSLIGACAAYASDSKNNNSNLGAVAEKKTGKFKTDLRRVVS